MSVQPSEDLDGLGLGPLIHSGLVHQLHEAEGDGGRLVVGVLQPDLARVPRLRSAYLDGLGVAASVVHPVLVDIGRVGGDGRRAWVVMQRIEGESLGQLAARAPALPLGKVLRYARDVLLALSEVHALGLVHGCVSPSKIIAPASGRARLLGLGLGIVRRRAIELVHGGVPPGSEATFIAPEQREGAAASPRSDLWSLGAVIEALLDREGAALGTRGASPSPSGVASSRIPGCPPSLARLLDRALCAEPARRFATATEMREVVEEVMYMHGSFSVRRGASPPAPAQVWTRPPTPAPASGIVPAEGAARVRGSARTEPSLGIDRMHRAVRPEEDEP